MTYVFDTNAFIRVGLIPRSTFKKFWAEMDTCASSERIVSVDEVRKELDQENASPDLKTWIDQHKVIFGKPDAQEQTFMAEIFRNKHYQQPSSQARPASRCRSPRWMRRDSAPRRGQPRSTFRCRS